MKKQNILSSWAYNTAPLLSLHWDDCCGKRSHINGRTYLKEPWKRRPTLPGTRVSRGWASWGHTFRAFFNNHHPSSSSISRVWAFKFAFPAWPPSFSTARRGEKLWVRVDSNGNPPTPDEGPPHLATIRWSKDSLRKLIFHFQKRAPYKRGGGDVEKRGATQPDESVGTLFTKSYILRENWRTKNFYLNLPIFVSLLFNVDFGNIFPSEGYF